MNSCLIADDHVLMREALAGTVRLVWPNADIIEVGDFPAAWAAVADAPDVAIVDLMMPGADPVSGVRALRQASPGTAILIVTGTDDDRLMLDLLDLGIAGFAPKTASGGIIEAALRLIAAGGRYLPARLAAIAAASHDAVVTPPAPSRPTGLLTERQLDVLRLIAAGLSNKEVALRLNLSPATVKTHLAHAQVVLGAKNRTDAVVRARAHDAM